MILTALLLPVVSSAVTAAPAAGQGPTMPSTLRYGSGLLDVPVSSVLPHKQVTATFSGFWVDVDRSVRVNEAGEPVGYGPGVDGFYSDGSVAVGLFDRGELGLSVQALGGPEDGGDLWGLFGRLRLLQPLDQGLGLAVGGRYLTGPDFGDGVDREPGRLGFPDARLRAAYPGSGRSMGTGLSLYGVATAYLRGFDGGRVPENDLTLSLGYGSGLFKSGPEALFYGPAGANGWFAGASSHWKLDDAAQLALMVEHNGFDVNVGAQVDVSGIRAGLHYLATNHPEPSGGYASAYRAPKLGFSLSVAICPDAPAFRCRPGLMERTEPDTIFLPPPPPDTVVLAPAEVAPEGEPATVCLSTGQNVPVRITADGDTLVGPRGVPMESLRPVVEFAGAYAEGSAWLERGEDIVFEDAAFRPSGEGFAVDCGQVLRVGVHEGVPVFADRAALRPLDVIFVPVRVGLWQRYERVGREEAVRVPTPRGSSVRVGPRALPLERHRTGSPRPRNGLS